VSFLVELVTMSQEMSLEDGSVTNFIVLRLPTGTLVKALISDESASQVVHAKVTGTSAPPVTVAPLAAPTPPSVKELTGTAGDNFSLTEDSALVFGVAEAKPIAPTPQQTVQHAPPPLPRRKATRVEKDEWGYPILRTPGGVDVNEVIGGRDRDEDGFGQV